MKRNNRSLAAKMDRLRDHNRFLTSMGVKDPASKPKQRRFLKGPVASPLQATSPVRAPLSEQPPTSDMVPSSWSKRDMKVEVQAGREAPATLEQMEAVQKSVAQLYPKGPFGPVTDPAHHLTNSRRPPT